MTGSSASDAAKAARLAEALRANLRRRKAARTEPSAEAAPTGPAPSKPEA